MLLPITLQYRVKALLKGIPLVTGAPFSVSAVASLSRHRQRRLIQRSRLFDPSHYLEQARHHGSIASDPLGHYLDMGEQMGLRPNPWFDPIWYRERSPAEIASTMSPLVHYILAGSRRRLSTSPAFNSSKYLAANPDVAAAKLEPLAHFLMYGRAEGRHLAPRLVGDGWFGRPVLYDLGTLNLPSPANSISMTEFSALSDTSQSGEPAVLHITHQGGGGTERAVAEQVNASPRDRHLVLMARGSECAISVVLLVPSNVDTKAFVFQAVDILSLVEALLKLNIGRAVVHQPVGFSGRLSTLLEQLNVPYEVAMHDYTLICPRSSLVSVTGEYCGEPDAVGCSSCLKKKPQAITTDIETWREQGIQILHRAERIHCAVEDIAKRIHRYAPAGQVQVSPLSPPVVRTAPICTPLLPKDGALRVATLGHVYPAKGSNFLLDCVEIAIRKRIPIAWTVIGSVGGADISRVRRLSSVLKITGAYEPDVLDQFLETADPHVIFFPQRCVETWSYALSEAIASCRVILAPDLGAFRDRLKGIEGSYHYGPTETPSRIVESLVHLRRRFELN